MRNLQLILTGTTYSQNKVEISQNFVAFSEYMNFTHNSYFSSHCTVVRCIALLEEGYTHTKKVVLSNIFLVDIA